MLLFCQRQNFFFFYSVGNICRHHRDHLNPPCLGCHVPTCFKSTSVIRVQKCLQWHSPYCIYSSGVLRNWSQQTLRPLFQFPQYTFKYTPSDTTAPWIMALHLSSLLRFVTKTTKSHLSNNCLCLLHLCIDHSLSPDPNKLAALKQVTLS